MAETAFDINKVISDAQRVATAPATFYREMPQTGGFTEPCIFLVVMAFISGLLMAVFSLFGLGHIGAMAVGFVSLIMFPVMALIGSFIGAAVMFIIWKLMGSEKEFETAYRCVAYASVIYPLMPLVGWIPYLGTIITLGLGMLLMYLATIEVHAIKQQTAQAVIGLLAAVMLLMQLSGEYGARHMQASIEESTERWQQSATEMNKALENMAERSEDMTPEEAGRIMGEFFKGMSESLPPDVREQMQKSMEAHAQE